MSHTLLLVAHPGHELLLYGWIRQVRPIVCVLTDGSGFDAGSRLAFTRELLRSLGAQTGALFGLDTDREVYANLLGGRTAWLFERVDALAALIAANGITTVVTDALEGYNPVHDLCRTIAGAAAEEADVAVRHYEYAIDGGPQAYDASSSGVIVHSVDEVMLAEKIAAAHRLAAAVPDVLKMLVDFGESSFRDERLRPIPDWTAVSWKGSRPQYEILGEERVAAGRYREVIRWSEHVEPLIASLRARIRHSSPCTS